MKIFKTIDEKFEEIGFIKVEEKSGNKRDIRNNKIEERKNGRPQKTLETQAEQTVSNIEGQ